MKKVGLFLLAVVMLVGMAGCDGDGGPTGSSTDISGRWEVTFDGSETFFILLTQAADGSVTGHEERFPTDSTITGTSNGSTYELKLNRSNLTTHYYHSYDLSITLHGDTFDGTGDFHAFWANKQNRPVSGKRA